MSRAFSLGKVFGIQFRVHVSWFIIFALVTISLVEPRFMDWRYWILGVIASLLLFASVLAHELAHSLVGRANGMPVSSITLFIFGGVSEMTKEAPRASAEFKMAAAGPLCSLVLGAVFGLVLLIRGIPDPVASLLYWLAVTNGMLAAFNLIPGFPLDGGRILRSSLWRVTGSYGKSSRFAIRLGQIIGYLLIIGGIAVIFIRPADMAPFNGVWFAFVGLFLENAASASYRQLMLREAAYLYATAGLPPTGSKSNPGSPGS